MLCILLPYFGREIYTVALYCVVCFLHPCYTALGIYLSALGTIAVLMGHCTSSRSGRLLVVLGSLCASLGILWMVPFAHLFVCVGLGFSYYDMLSLFAFYLLFSFFLIGLITMINIYL